MCSGRRILGHATDLIFSGWIGHQLPVGLTKEQASKGCGPAARTRSPTCCPAMDVVPGAGIDFTAVGHVLLLVLALYIGASLLALFQGG